MWFGFITLFPEMFHAMELGVVGRALKQQRVSYQCWNPRDFTEDPSRHIDDHPYGGGPGMVMQAAPLQQAIWAAKKAAPVPPKVVYVSPQGRLFDQKKAVAEKDNAAFIFVAGRYEGVDERLIETEVDEEWSIGDYILSGGELAVMVICDTMTRLLPAVLGHEESASSDTFANGLLEHPHYTRPSVFANRTVPEVLMSGNHAAIHRWRLKQALGRTWLRRPDLLMQYELDKTNSLLLKEFIDECKE